MRRRVFTLSRIARAAGYAVVAAAIGATALRFRYDGVGVSASPPTPSVESDPLAAALARCQAIGMAATDDAACEADWAENRRRFFTYRPTDSAASTRPTDPLPAARREGQ